MVKVVSSVNEALSSLQKETGSIKNKRLKADLQRAPNRGARTKACANGNAMITIVKPQLLSLVGCFTSTS